MLYGLISGLLWGMGAVILGIASSVPEIAGFEGSPYIIACVHDIVCALFLLILMGSKKRLGDTIQALKTKNGRVIVLAALIGGPIGMSGYLTAISNIGPGYTAIISAFYPAVGSFLAYFVLKEKMSLKQVVSLAVAIGAVMMIGYYGSQASVDGNYVKGIIGALFCVVGWGSEAVILTWGMQGDGVDDEVALQIRETTSALAYLLIVVPVASDLQYVSNVLSMSAIWVIVIAAACGTASYLFYYKALNTIGAARGMAANISYSAWAVVFSFLILHTVPSVVEIISCIVIMVATVLASASDWSDFKITK